MYHYRKTRKQYIRHKNKRAGSCPFCENDRRNASIEETNHAWIIPNLTFYDLWEMRDVTDHLMVVPKRHVETLRKLSAEERLDVMDLLAAYEAKGYDIYARSPDSVTKSVPHQHTHLIKTRHKKAQMSVFLRKPYFVFKI